MNDLALFTNGRLDLFEVHWTAIEKLMEEEAKPPPKMSKTLKGPKFVERISRNQVSRRNQTALPTILFVRELLEMNGDCATSMLMTTLLI